MALSQSDAAKFAMAVKNARPDITDEELSSLVQEAGQVNDDPIKSQSLAAKMLPQLNTQLADPYAGAGHTAADAMRQFSPEQLKAAYAQQQAAYQQNQPSRAIGGILAGGSGSADVMNKNKADWEGIDKQNMLQSIDQQVALQDQATKGLNAAKGVQDMAAAAGKYSGTQIEQQQKLQTSQFTLDQQKRMNDPNSNETALAKSLILSQVGSMDNVSKAQMQKIVSQPGVTAQQLLPAMAQWAPGAQKAFTEKVSAGKTVADTTKTYAEVPGVVAEGRVKTGVADTVTPSHQQEMDRESMRIIRAEYDKTPDGHPDKASLMREMQRLSKTAGIPLQGLEGTNLSLNVGGASITPSPATTGSQTGMATDQDTTRKQATHYSTNISDPAEKLLSVVRAGSNTTGLGAKLPASWSNTQADVAQKAINKIVAENAAMNGTAYNQADADTLFKAGPSVVADYVLNMKAEQGRRQLKLAAQEDWQKTHKGTLQGFNPGELSKFKPMYNPATGKVALIPEGSEEWNNRLKNKWVPSQTGYYMNQGK